MENWVPLFSKLVWPLFLALAFLFLRDDLGRLVSASVERIEQGGGFKTPWFELGEAAANTGITDLAASNLPIEAMGGNMDAVRKGSDRYLQRLQEQLEMDPNKSIDTLLLVKGTPFSTDLLKQYVGTLGLRYVVFQDGNRLDGWMMAGTFVAQLPRDPESSSYSELKSRLKGIRTVSVASGDSATKVLEQMRTSRMDALPVLDGQRLRFFVTRGEILSSLMANLIVSDTGGA